AALVCSTGGAVRADDGDAKAVLDKAIKAKGGEAKLSMGKAATWKTKGTFSFGGNESNFTAQTTIQGLDQLRGEFEGDFMGNKFMAVTVLNGDKGWRKFADMTMDLDKDSIANERRTVYLQVIPALLVPLKGAAFKSEAAGEEKVGDKPAAVIKVTGP